MSSESPTITYTEPSLPSLLTLVAFLYLLQVSRFTANKLFSAGLLGEIALGIVFGSPLAGILDRSWEQTFMFVGYWGLILIVFEGVYFSPTSYKRRSRNLMTLISYGYTRWSGLQPTIIHPCTSPRHRDCVDRSPSSNRVFICYPLGSVWVF